MKIVANRKQRNDINWVVPVVVLWLLVLASALGVVASTHEVRQRVDALETLRREAVELEVVWGQYLLEQSTWASYGRIERLAEDELSMKVPKAEHIVMVLP
ncbi:cell division protein FtsL [Marinimicrobium sp. ABcell2]|uniref:cell division protein FtsL n=1 Tax=Marinimicrobium sp. ABcell2 TaxID=3069751 RepID=UPI0027B407C8|nr:cell division protein FtsL [Marinimicrobium sp. ABcell2]MDQ2075080.1 cell division protein FtsL [Marinimicrobium sp. ABcell2]